MSRPRRISTGQRLGLMGLLLTLFYGLFRLVRAHKTDRFDTAVTAEFQKVKNPRLSRLMHLVSWPGFPPQSRIIPWLLPIAWLLRGKWLEAVVQGAGWGTGVLSTIFKRKMKRPRPDKARFYFAPARIGGTSFPSGHVINYIGVYGTAAYLASFNIKSRPLRWLVRVASASLISLVGPSRVYLGHHWATDVTASYLLGSSYLLGLGGVHEFGNHVEILPRLRDGPAGVAGRCDQAESDARLPRVAHHARRVAGHRAAAIGHEHLFDGVSVGLDISGAREG